jgi:GNAT superfamily N-acetyltransferase
MLVRLALEKDKPALHAIGRLMNAEVSRNREYDEERANATFEKYMNGANPTIFVAEHKHQIVGILVAYIIDYAFNAGFYVAQEVLYVRPDMRGTRAAARLVIQFNEWADSLNPSEIHMGIATGYHVDASARFIERFGFTRAGHYFRRIAGER